MRKQKAGCPVLERACEKDHRAEAEEEKEKTKGNGHAPENPTVQEATSGRKTEKEEQSRNGKVWRAAKKNTEKFNGRRRGMLKKNTKQRPGEVVAYTVVAAVLRHTGSHRTSRRHM